MCIYNITDKTLLSIFRRKDIIINKAFFSFFFLDNDEYLDSFTMSILFLNPFITSIRFFFFSQSFFYINFLKLNWCLKIMTIVINLLIFLFIYLSICLIITIFMNCVTILRKLRYGTYLDYDLNLFKKQKHTVPWTFFNRGIYICS